MTAAYRLKGLGWLGGVTVLSLAFYLVSLQVAAERKKLEQADGQIAAARRDIRALETEFDTRANLTQLERWNGDTLALSAPTAAQFVRDEAQLASIDLTALPGAAQVRAAALIVPALPAAAAPVASAAQIVTPPPPVVAASAPVVVEKVAASTDVPAPTVRPAVALRVKPDAALRSRPEMALLDRKLLSDSTLGDLLSGARSEGRSR